MGRVFWKRSNLFFYHFTYSWRVRVLYQQNSLYYWDNTFREEGVRLMSNIVDCDYSNVEIEKKLKVVYKKLNDDIIFPCFTLV